MFSCSHRKQNRTVSSLSNTNFVKFTCLAPAGCLSHLADQTVLRYVHTSMLKEKGPVLSLAVQLWITHKSIVGIFLWCILISVCLQLVAGILRYVADLTIQYLRFLFALNNTLFMLVLILQNLCTCLHWCSKNSPALRCHRSSQNNNKKNEQLWKSFQVWVLKLFWKCVVTYGFNVRKFILVL